MAGGFHGVQLFLQKKENFLTLNNRNGKVRPDCRVGTRSKRLLADFLACWQTPSWNFQTHPSAQFSGFLPWQLLAGLSTGASQEQQMAKGNVKWFNDSKGYGFISVSDPGAQSGQDVFVHHTAILSEGYRTLSEGMEVEFDILQGEKGLLASNVRRVA